MRNSNFDTHCKAMKLFSPLRLCEHLTKDNNGIVFFDRKKAIGTEEQKVSFMVIMSHDYMWDYRDYDKVSVYFTTEDDKIYGGIYNVATKQCITRVLIASSGGNTPYTYRKPSIVELINVINNA